MADVSHKNDLPPIAAIEDTVHDDSQPSSTRHSPVLAPLELLQQSRRKGSITDPALHAAPNTSAVKPSLGTEPPLRVKSPGEDAASNTTPSPRRTPEPHGTKRKSPADGDNGDSEPLPKRKTSNSSNVPLPHLPPMAAHHPHPQWWGPPGYIMAPPPPGVHPFPWPPGHPPPTMYTPFDPHAPPPIHGMMPPMPFGVPPDRRLPVPEPSSSRQSRSGSAKADSPKETESDDRPAAKTGTYTRSPELRVSHKIAERKRRKEMKELFDELQEHLPNDRGLKSSKWEILHKAIEHVQFLKQRQLDMEREIGMLRHEVDMHRQGAGLPLLAVAPAPIVFAHRPPPSVHSESPTPQENGDSAPREP